MSINRNWLVSGAMSAAVSAITTAAVSCGVVGGSGPLSTESQSQVYEQKVVRIEFDTEAGDISVSSGDADRVTVDRKLRWRQNKPTFKEEWRGDTLHITADCVDEKDCTLDYTVRAPANVAIIAKSVAGDVSVRDLTGELELSNDAGDITVEGSRGRVSINGKAGAITGRSLRSSDVTVQSDAGDVNLTFAEAPATASVTLDSGDVKVAVPRAGGYKVKATTSAGDRKVSVDEDSNGRHSIVVAVGSGDVTVAYA